MPVALEPFSVERLMLKEPPLIFTSPCERMPRLPSLASSPVSMVLSPVKDKDCQQKFFAESGERLEANSVDIGEGRLTIAFCDEFYTNFNESAVDGSYLSDGLEIEFPPKLSSQDFTLSVAWVNKVEGDDDVRTWLAVSW